MQSTTALKYKRTLQNTVSSHDSTWEYNLGDLPTFKDKAPNESDDHVILKFVSFNDNAITISFNKQKLNRILTLDHPSTFCAVSFAQFELIEDGTHKKGDYIEKFLLTGLKLNGKLYKCFGWSNSQLKSRCCLLYAFPAGESAMQKLDTLGAFKDIVQVGKMAKRIGLLFSEAELGLQLPQHLCKDIPDIESEGQVFSDGCGLMPFDFAKQIAQSKKITFHGLPYTPSVVQIRYRGYKGVLMINIEKKDKQVQFRKSMHKFTGCPNNMLSVLDYSKPYVFGKLNAELVTLLSALGISDDVFLQKQQEYFDMITEASADPVKAFVFMSYMRDQTSADRVVLEGLESVGSALKHLQTTAWAKMFDKKDTERVHFMIRKSRLLLGICDFTGTLRPNECHVRITIEGGGVRSLDGAWVIVARNPCLHPGDIRKLRVRHIKGFEKLVDCIVFPTTGRVPQPSMMSGGDLDGDQFFVCWDSDLIPMTLHEPHPYPPAKEKPKNNITHDDLVRYFAHWTNASMGRISNIYREWVRASPDGARSRECLELNHLYSLSVDGERVDIPQRLRSAPKRNEELQPFIVDKLTQQVSSRAKTIRFGLRTGVELDAELIQFLAAADEICLTEFELFQLVNLWASKNHASMRQFINHFDFMAFTADQRSWIRTCPTLDMSPQELDALLKNGLLQSSILSAQDLKQYGLDSPNLHWRRLYSTQTDGESLFFSMLTSALEDFTRKLLVLDVASETQFKVGVMISKRIKPIDDRDDTVVDESVVAFSFRPGKITSGKHISTTKGYRLGWDGTVFQLFNITRGNTFVWFRKPQTRDQGPLGLVSIALNRFGAEVTRNVGRIYRAPLQRVEIYVITNRDRVGHELLDLSYGNVPTENLIERITNVPEEYSLESIQTIDWSVYSGKVREIVEENKWDFLNEATNAEIEDVGTICCWAQDFQRLIRLIRWHIEKRPPHNAEVHLRSLLTSAPRVCVLMKDLLMEENAWNSLFRHPTFMKAYCTALIRSANYAPGLVRDLFEHVLDTSPGLSFEDNLDLISIISTSVRSSLLAVELITLLDNTMKGSEQSSVDAQSEAEYLTMLARNVSLDRCADAEESCKCDEWGITLAETSKYMVDSLKVEDNMVVTASFRVDLAAPFRIGDHIRLRSATPPKDAPLQKPRVLDGLISQTDRGSMKITLMEPPPPERCSWYIFSAGNNTTASAILKAIGTLAKQKHECCQLYSKIIPGVIPNILTPSESEVTTPITYLGLNPSQTLAVAKTTHKNLTLIWGPPGTGKTTTIVRIIDEWRRSLEEGERILVAASTNNAVDNVLEKYISEKAVTPQDIVRVCPESSALSKAVIRFWVGAFVEGDFNKPSAAMREAQKKVSQAKIVFATCTGAALGLLRKLDFAHVIVDEASQITEPNCLIALVKGCKRVALVGDHVQLRPTVTPLGRAYGYDVSLFERLYKRSDTNTIAKVLLDTQYRMHPQIAVFPSQRFYGGKLLCGVTAKDREVTESEFDWEGRFVKFVKAPGLPEGKESFYHNSKNNESQAKICRTIVSNLQKMRLPSKNIPSDADGCPARDVPGCKMSIAVLTPYTAQQKLLQDLEKPVDSKTVSSVTVATVDSFQGREADIVIFCTVRCNANNSIGFLADERRINVAFTRAKRGFIVVGHKETLVQSEEGGQFWKAWFESLQTLK